MVGFDDFVIHFQPFLFRTCIEIMFCSASGVYPNSALLLNIMSPNVICLFSNSPYDMPRVYTNESVFKSDRVHSSGCCLSMLAFIAVVAKE